MTGCTNITLTISPDGQVNAVMDGNKLSALEVSKVMLMMAGQFLGMVKLPEEEPKKIITPEKRIIA